MSQIRHLVATQRRVIDLYEAGWRPTAIQRLLKEEGLDVPSRNTIWVWTHPEKGAAQAKRDLARTRRWRTQRASFSWPGVRGPEWKICRMQVLRDGGLSCAAIASVMTIDFPDTPLTEHQVRGAMTEGRMPRNLKAAA